MNSATLLAGLALTARIAMPSRCPRWSRCRWSGDCRRLLRRLVVVLWRVCAGHLHGGASAAACCGVVPGDALFRHARANEGVLTARVQPRVIVGAAELRCRRADLSRQCTQMRVADLIAASGHRSSSDRIGGDPEALGAVVQLLPGVLGVAPVAAELESARIGTSSLTASQASRATSSPCSGAVTEQLETVVHLQQRDDAFAPAGAHPQLGVTRGRSLDQRVQGGVDIRRGRASRRTRDARDRLMRCLASSSEQGPAPLANTYRAPSDPNAGGRRHRAGCSRAGWPRAGRPRRAATRTAAADRTGRRSPAPRPAACRSSRRISSRRRRRSWRS